MFIRTAIAMAVLSVALAACNGKESKSEPRIVETLTTPSTSDAQIVVQNFQLNVHCGVYELTYRGKYYSREGGSLDDNNGNPPDGWDSYAEIGTLTLRGNTAAFTDKKGHNEKFDLRPGATRPIKMCA